MPSTRASSGAVNQAAAAALAATSNIPQNPAQGSSGASGSSKKSTGKTTSKRGRKKGGNSAAPPVNQGGNSAAPPANAGGNSAAPPANSGGAVVPPADPAAQQQQQQQQAPPPPNGAQAYDPADPTDEGDMVMVNRLELAADLKDFLGEHIADVRQGLLNELTSKTSELKRLFDAKVSEEVEHTKKKLLVETPVNFKHDYNVIHYDRCQSSLSFVIDARKALKERNYEEADVYLAAHEEAIKEHMKHIKWADASPVCWELIKRLRASAKDKEIQQIEAEIIREREEKRNAGRKRQRRERSPSPEVQEVGKKSGGSNSGAASSSGKARFENNGPCIWCSKHGHIYRFCDLWKADVDAKRAEYNTTTRKWERVKNYDELIKKS